MRSFVIKVVDTVSGKEFKGTFTAKDGYAAWELAKQQATAEIQDLDGPTPSIRLLYSREIKS